MPIKHSACHWCYAESIPLEEFCRQGKALGLDAVDLLTPDQMEIADRYSLACPIIANPVTRLADGTAVGIIEAAFNRLEHHDALVEVYTDYLKAAKSAGAQNVICFSGNRNGMDDQTGMENCATGIRRLLPLLDELDVTLTMELLNSKVDHPDYMCDHTKWGVQRVSNCSTTSTTCRLWKAMLSPRLRNTISGSVIITPVECPDAMRLMPAKS